VFRRLHLHLTDIQRAVADRATVPIYYESRISKLSLNAAALPGLMPKFEEIKTEGEEQTSKEKLETSGPPSKALVGDPQRLALVAADLVAHVEKRWRRWYGKANGRLHERRHLRRSLHNALIQLRPEWRLTPSRW